VNHDQVKNLIKNTLKRLGHKYNHNNAVKLLFWTGYVESRYEYIQQLNDGPAKSFWQFEPESAVSCVKHYLKYRKVVREQCARATITDISLWESEDLNVWSWVLEHNMAVAIVMARLKYWRSPQPLPKNIDEAGSMWKIAYNTSKGKGSVAKFKSLISNINK